MGGEERGFGVPGFKNILDELEHKLTARVHPPQSKRISPMIVLIQFALFALHLLYRDTLKTNGSSLSPNKQADWKDSRGHYQQGRRGSN